MMAKPVLEDQYTAARVYFACVIGMLFIESAFHLPTYLMSLRARGPVPAKASSHWKLHIYLHKLATLPSLVPRVTNHHLPNLFRFSVIAGLNVLFGYNKVEYTTDYKLYGWLAIANGGLALLLSARWNLFSLILRLPSSTLLIYHRFIGFCTFVQATLHIALNLNHDIKTKQIADTFLATRIRVGLMAWIALAILIITSMPFIRRRFFEVFYYPHFLFLVFVGGAIYHTTNGPEFFLPGLSLWAVDRLLRFVNNFHKVSVSEATWLDGDVTKLRLDGIQSRAPAQVVWIQIPKLSRLNWHPFSIAAAPGEPATIAVRGLGTFTRLVQGLDVTYFDENGRNDTTPRSSDLKELRVRADGPYGVASELWGYKPFTVIVAGGIGITPGISIAQHIMNQASSLSLPKSRSTEKSTQNTTQCHIHMLWVIKDMHHAKWFEADLWRLSTMAADDSLPVTFDLTIHVTGAKSTLPVEETGNLTSINPERVAHPLSVSQQSDTNEIAPKEVPGEMVAGRPDILGWFRRCKMMRPGMDAAVSICGPRSLLDDARQAAAKVSDAHGLFSVEEELFEL